MPFPSKRENLKPRKFVPLQYGFLGGNRKGPYLM